MVFLAFIVLLAVFAIASQSQSKVKSYYSGDAIGFNNQVYVVSANTGSLEVLRLDGEALSLIGKIKPFDTRFGRYDNFYDAKFSAENNKLFVYAVSGFTLYKYQVNGNNVELVAEKKNSSWEWYTRVDKFGDNVVTISDKSVKVWKSGIFDTIDSHPVVNKQNPYNVRANNDRYITNIQGDYLTIYDSENRTELPKIALNYKNKNDNHKVYQSEDGKLYLCDDYYFKKFDLSGRLLGSFRHLDYQGYDAAASGHSNFVYFSNGLGVVKLNKDTMELAVSQETVQMSGAGGWAMGLSVVYTGGDRVVVFNNSSILVLDDQLNKLASYQATEEADSTSIENLYLSLDRNVASPSSLITLNGGGFYPNEKLSIDFAGTKINGQADYRGRFSQDLVVPSSTVSHVDIKVDGDNSRLSYSIDFHINITK